MALKYALYPYDSLPGNAGNFVVYDVELQYSYPTAIDTTVTDITGQEQPIFNKWIPCVLVYRDPLAIGHENIINNAWSTWDSSNPTNTKPVEMQTIFTEAEFDLIFQQVETKTQSLISSLP